MKNRYTLFILIVSISVATLIHFPELVSLFDVFESQTLFPGMRPADVASEVFFMLAVFYIQRYILFHHILIFSKIRNLIVQPKPALS